MRCGRGFDGRRSGRMRGRFVERCGGWMFDGRKGFGRWWRRWIGWLCGCGGVDGEMMRMCWCGNGWSVCGYVEVRCFLVGSVGLCGLWRPVDWAVTIRCCRFEVISPRSRCRAWSLMGAELRRSLFLRHDCLSERHPVLSRKSSRLRRRLTMCRSCSGQYCPDWPEPCLSRYRRRRSFSMTWLA